MLLNMGSVLLPQTPVQVRIRLFSNCEDLPHNVYNLTIHYELPIRELKNDWVNIVELVYLSFYILMSLKCMHNYKNIQSN